MTPLDHVVEIGRRLDAVGAPWVLGGSLASSFVGEPRSTMDVDVAVLLQPGQVDRLVAAVEGDYYVDADMAHDAVQRHSSFNLIHFATSMKVDLFALSNDALDARQLARRQRVDLAPGVAIWVGSAVDQVLRKLHWFRLGGEVSERQWRDILSILRVQGPRLDRAQLHAESAPLGLADLVERAFGDLGGSPGGTGSSESPP